MRGDHQLDFQEHMARCRALLDPRTLNREAILSLDRTVVVEVLLGMGGPTEWLECVWRDPDGYDKFELPDSIRYQYSYGEDRFTYLYPADAIPYLWGLLKAAPPSDDEQD